MPPEEQTRPYGAQGGSANQPEDGGGISSKSRGEHIERPRAQERRGEGKGNEQEQRAQRQAQEAQRGQPRARRRRASSTAQSGRAEADLEKPRKRLTGIGFWLVFLLALTKDGLDVLANLTVFLAILTIPTGLFLWCIVFLYLLINGVFSVERYFAGKLAIMLATVIIEITPFINFFPTFAVSLLLIRWIEHNAYLKELVQYESVREAILEKGGEVREGLRRRQERRQREAQRRRAAQTA